MKADETKPAVKKNNQARTLGSREVVEFLTLLLLAGGLAFQYGQNKLLRQQVEAQLHEPKFEITAFHEPGEREGLIEARRSIIDEFFDAIQAPARANPKLRYADLIEEVLPISRELQPAPIRMNVRINNSGDASATGVTVFASWSGQISSLDLGVMSGWRLLDGGVGFSDATIEIERIAVGETAEITIAYSPDQSVADSLVLEMAPIEEETGDAGLSYFPPFPDYLRFPNFRLATQVGSLPYDSILIRIGSDQVPVQEIEVSSASPWYSGLIDIMNIDTGKSAP